MTNKMINLRLYVSRGAPNSQLALQNLKAICEKYLPGRFHIDVIDLLERPSKALEDGVLLTPMLLILSHQPPLRVMGNLSDPEPVLAALEINENDFAQ